MNMSMGVFIVTHCQGEVGAGVAFTVNPSLTGDAIVGETLTVSLGTATGATALAGSLRHVSDDTEVDTFAADGTYEIQDTDFGQHLYLHVTAEPGGVTAVSAATGAVAFVDDFARADGDLGNGWDYSAGKWAVVSGSAVATPTVAANNLTNGSMESGNPPSSWTAQNSATLAGVADERTGGAGAQSLQLLRGSAARAARQFRGGFGNNFVKVTAWGKVATADRVDISGAESLVAVDATDWAQIAESGFVPNAKNWDIELVGSGGDEARVDDYIAYALATAELFAVWDAGTPHVRVSVEASSFQSCAVGAAVCVDSQANPQNCIVAYIHRGGGIFAASVVVRKCVAGTWSQVAAISIAYTDGAALALEHADTTVRVFYNGVQVGVDYVVNDASIVSNTLHGMFNTTSENTIQSCTITAAPP